MSKTALITGITGQDGSYLCELLLSKYYTVHGWTRNARGERAIRLRELLIQNGGNADNLHLHEVDVTNQNCVADFFRNHSIDEVFNLAAQSHVGESFHSPQATFAANAGSVHTLLEGIKSAGRQHEIRFFQASSAAIYEGAETSPQNEETPFAPRSPYAQSKLEAHQAVVQHREHEGMFACNGILYNHESPRRPETFVTGKIVTSVVQIARGQQKELHLGNIDVSRDWGFAGDYVKAMWLMLQAEAPADYIIATGALHSLEEFLQIAFETVGLDWRDYTVIDQEAKRPIDPAKLVGNPHKIQQDLGWKATMSFADLVEYMVRQKMLELRSKPA